MVATEEKPRVRRGRYTVSIDAELMGRLDGLLAGDRSGRMSRSWLVEVAVAHFLHQLQQGDVTLTLPGVEI